MFFTLFYFHLCLHWHACFWSSAHYWVHWYVRVIDLGLGWAHLCSRLFDLQSWVLLHFTCKFYCIILSTNPRSFRFTLYFLNAELFNQILIKIWENLRWFYFWKRYAHLKVDSLIVYCCVDLTEKVWYFISTWKYLNLCNLLLMARKHLEFALQYFQISLMRLIKRIIRIEIHLQSILIGHIKIIQNKIAQRYVKIHLINIKPCIFLILSTWSFN